MRVVYMGTPDIARVCLERLYTSGACELAAVYTKPDMPKNRGMKLTQSPVKEFALAHGLPVVQPETFRDDAAVEQLRALAPELIVVVAYGKILPQRVLDIPQYGCINMHASILPELRGAGPVQWSILNHCAETGVSAMYLTAGMDEGDVIEIRKTPIDPMETSEELMARLADIAASLACDTVRAIENGTAGRTPQDAAKATYAPMLDRSMSPIDWTQPAQWVIDQVRGLIPWPVATAELAGTAFKIFRVENTDQTTDKAPGTVLGLDKKGLLVACGEGGVLRVTQLQAQGGRRMAAAAGQGLLYREQPFVLGIPVASTVSSESLHGKALRTTQEAVGSTDEWTLVQGIIDAFFYEDGEIVLMDYKTDRLYREEDFRERYGIQLEYYRRALEQITGKQVKETWIYSFTLGRAIRL